MSFVRVTCSLVVLLAACGNDGTVPAGGDASVDGPGLGQLGGACFPNHTCYEKLRCVNATCVLGTDAAAEKASGGDGGSTDSKPVADRAAIDAKAPDLKPPAPDAKPPQPDAKLLVDLAPDSKPKPDTKPSPDSVPCASSCAGKSCGADDGCGKPCQTGSCPGPQEVCVLGACQCQPSCSGKVCGGPDGCGGSCKYGSCAKPNSVCNGGTCDCAYAACGSVCCGLGEYCLANSCTPGVTPGWKVIASPTLKDLYGVWGSAWNNIWAVGAGGTVLHYNGSAWGPENSTTTSDLTAVSGSSASNVWAVASNKVLRYDGSSWGAVSYPNTSDRLSDVYVAGSHTFVAGDNGAQYGAGRHPLVSTWNGSWTRWQQASSSGYLVAIGGSSATSVWAQGWNSLVNYNGAWQEATFINDGFWNGIFGVAVDDVWVAGWNNGGCVLYHYNGKAWGPVTCPTSQGLYRAHGTGATDIWAVGNAGTIIHYDGKGWALSGAGVTTKTLRGVWAASATDVWAVGGGGTILHYAP